MVLLKACEGESVSRSSSRETSECFISQLLMLKVQGEINIAVENLLPNRAYFVLETSSCLECFAKLSLFS